GKKISEVIIQLYKPSSCNGLKRGSTNLINNLAGYEAGTIVFNPQDDVERRRAVYSMVFEMVLHPEYIMTA
ncbi:MAG: hypothetical protein ACTSUN_06205, partial [Promethearchaeota archaeon]